MLYHCHYPHICFIQAHYVSNINDIASGVQGNQFASSRTNTMYIYNLQSTAVLLLWIKVSVRLWELRCLRFFASLCHSWQNKKTKCTTRRRLVLYCYVMISMLKHYTDRRSLWCSATFFPEVPPSSPSCFSRNVRAHAVMSLAWLTDTSLEGSSNSCNVATRGKSRY